MQPPEPPQPDPLPARDAPRAASFASRALEGVTRLLAWSGLPVGFFLCAPLAFTAIWSHRFLPGVDLPEHAELVRLWVDLYRGNPDVTSLYELRLLTPYTLAYLLAFPVAALFNAMSGIKVVLTIAVLSAPWMMTRWLRAVGGDPRLGVIGFLVAFGWPFLWGFLSHCLALGLMFGYLTALERQLDRPSWRRGLGTLAWGLALFFCHGVTFGVAMVAAGARLLVRPRPFSAWWRAVLHFVPLGALTLTWMLQEEHDVSDKVGPWFMNVGRLKILLSSLYCVQASGFWSEVVAGAIVAYVLLVRPRVNRRAAAWAPLLVAIALFAVLPAHIASTDLIGPRVAVYVQAFFPAIFVARAGRMERPFAWLPTLAVLVSLVVLHVRLAAFNEEMSHFRDIAVRVEPGADVQNWNPHGTGRSDSFGYRQHSLAGAWLTSERGGIVEDDYAARFNMPVQRKHVPFPNRYRFIFSTAEAKRVQEAFPDAALRARSGEWTLWERPPQRLGALRVVRSAQGWGSLQVDASVVEEPLAVAGERYEHGFGTHADSWLELRAPLGGVAFEGACGLDDSGRDEARVRCDVRKRDGTVLWRSGVVKRGDPPEPFRVEFPQDAVLFLESASLEVNKGTHVDWVNLR